jgi:hypothetical protein
MAEKREEQAAQLAEATLTDEWVSEWEERIGLELRVTNVFNQNASYEAIRNFSSGIGDSNSLYREKNMPRAPVWSPHRLSQLGGQCYSALGPAVSRDPCRSFSLRLGVSEARLYQ